MNKKVLWFVLLLFIGLMSIVFIVTIAPSYLPSQPLPNITHIAPSSEPSWLSIHYPEQGQVLLLKDYSNNQSSLSPVCVEISPSSLMKANDVWDAGNIVERTIILVDGIQRFLHPIGKIHDFIVADLNGRAMGPYYFCVYAPVTLGIHKVDASFRTSSGMTPIFSWTFEVYNEETPIAPPTSYTRHD